ncbi:MAG: hypothetical protein OXF27_10840, partial [Acidobacteria bacterium]|nr:hypothetical protein [Acidobacteriota bacterium]
GGDVFNQAMTQAMSAADARRDANAASTEALEKPADMNFRDDRSIWDMNFGGYKGNTIAQEIYQRADQKARADDKAAEMAMWNASQVKPEFSPETNLMKTLGPAIMGQGAAGKGKQGSY